MDVSRLAGNGYFKLYLLKSICDGNASGCTVSDTEMCMKAHLWKLNINISYIECIFQENKSRVCCFRFTKEVHRNVLSLFFLCTEIVFCCTDFREVMLRSRRYTVVSG
jgi:hypothetical protein